MHRAALPPLSRALVALASEVEVGCCCTLSVCLISAIQHRLDVTAACCLGPAALCWGSPGSLSGTRVHAPRQPQPLPPRVALPPTDLQASSGSPHPPPPLWIVQREQDITITICLSHLFDRGFPDAEYQMNLKVGLRRRPMRSGLTPNPRDLQPGRANEAAKSLYCVASLGSHTVHLARTWGLWGPTWGRGGPWGPRSPQAGSLAPSGRLNFLLAPNQPGLGAQGAFIKVLLPRLRLRSEGDSADRRRAAGGRAAGVQPHPAPESGQSDLGQVRLLRPGTDLTHTRPNDVVWKWLSGMAQLALIPNVSTPGWDGRNGAFSPGRHRGTNTGAADNTHYGSVE
ncbi:unnamed protein product [Boreogadus saida]